MKKYQTIVRLLLASAMLVLALTGCTTCTKASKEKIASGAASPPSHMDSGKGLSTSATVWNDALSTLGYDMTLDLSGTAAVRSFMNLYLDEGADYTVLLNLKEGWYLDGETSGTAYARLESTETSNALYQSLCSYMQGLQAYADEPPVVITGKGAGYLYSTYAYDDSFDTTYLISITRAT